MVTEERHLKILSILRNKGFIEVSTLSNELNVSVETIRRDLSTLETLGELKRVRGGASSIESPSAPATPKPEKPNESDYFWYSPAIAPFKLCGFPFFEKDGVYSRFPLNPKEPLNPNVEHHGNFTSGGQIRFSAEFSHLALKVKLSHRLYATTFITGIMRAGFDVYLSDGDGYYSLFDVTKFSISTPEEIKDSYTCFFTEIDRKKYDVIINFPLGVGVEKVLVGMDKDSVPMSPPPFASDKRILMYGASIIHGYCASRPGMNVSNILSRWLNQEVINLAVNGSAKAERSEALAVREIDNVDWFIISTEGNCPSAEWVKEHLKEFLILYREKNPNVKIAVMSFMREARERFQRDYHEKRLSKKQAQIDVVKELKDAGDKNIFFWDGDDIFSEEDILFNGFSMSDENTVDGQHKTDVGFIQMAKAIYKRIK